MTDTIRREGTETNQCTNEQFYDCDDERNFFKEEVLDNR